MKVVCTSDTHGMHNYLKILEGDIFIFGGDISETGRTEEFIDFNNFLGNLPHKYKIITDGNHDLSPEKLSKLVTNAKYLQHSIFEIENIRIWGTSWQLWLQDQIQRKKNRINLQEFWKEIPSGIDILITHFPPFGIGDLTKSGTHLGSKDLLTALRRIKPKYHIFGHIHENYGFYKEIVDNFEITLINASAIIGFGIELNPSIMFNL